MRICVSGIGIVSAIGIGVEENLASIASGKDGMGRITLFNTIHTMPFAQVKASESELKNLLGLPAKELYTRTALLGMAAADEALRDSGIDTTKLRVGVVSATSTGGMDRTENFYASYLKDHTKGRIREVLSHECSDSTEHIARHCGINGFTTTISTACSSAANAVILGA
ncbi:MAG: beta-ketoacyl synthase N-terminal-like domain-containing protein, partial [Rikenellaceae bacterium]